MKRLEILWQRVTVDGGTCQRCGDTGQSVRGAARTLRCELAPLDIEVVLTEKALPPFAVEQSNRVFFNGRAMEDILGERHEVAVGMNHCQSCCEMLGGPANEPVDCRTLVVDGREHEALPEELLLRAGRLAAQALK